MLLSKLRRRAQDEQGFTLIELLVVILIIGILAAIALPTFLGQQSKAQDSSAKSDSRNLVSQIESCFTAAQTYTGCDTAASLANPGTSVGTAMSAPATVPASGTASIAVGTVVSAGDAYQVTSLSKSGMFFQIKKDNVGTITRTCGKTYASGAYATAPGGTNNQGGCNNGSW